jgi:hypothetical protein
MQELLSEYFGQDNGKTSVVYKEGKWFIAKLMENGKVVTHVTGFNEQDAENAAEDWVE